MIRQRRSWKNYNFQGVGHVACEVLNRIASLANIRRFNGSDISS